MPSFTEITYWIGSIYCSVWFFRFLYAQLRCIFGTSCTTSRYGVNSWAVVAGTSDNFGACMAI